MERKEKQKYEAPLQAVFEIKQKSVICDSQNMTRATRQDYDYEIW